MKIVQPALMDYRTTVWTSVYKYCTHSITINYYTNQNILHFYAEKRVFYLKYLILNSTFAIISYEKNHFVLRRAAINF